MDKIDFIILLVIVTTGVFIYFKVIGNTVEKRVEKVITKELINNNELRSFILHNTCNHDSLTYFINNYK
jgi:hypothetical protein